MYVYNVKDACYPYIARVIFIKVNADIIATTQAHTCHAACEVGHICMHANCVPCNPRHVESESLCCVQCVLSPLLPPILSVFCLV